MRSKRETLPVPVAALPMAARAPHVPASARPGFVAPSVAVAASWALAQAVAA